jgi:hypothetical protein
MPIATIIAIITAAAQTIPELAQIVPIVENMLNGNQPSAADIAMLESTLAALNAQASAAEQSAGATGPTS